jgi:DNA-binding NarL/FixJ family response regulator
MIKRLYQHGYETVFVKSIAREVCGMHPACPTATNMASNVKNIRILLADDHRILRSGLRELLEKQSHFEVVAEAENGRDAVNLSRELKPDVVIMDITMPDLNGIEATRQVVAGSPGAKVIILSVHSEQRFVAEVLKAGASGYVLKDCGFDEMVSAITTVNSGRIYLCSQITTVVRDDYIQHLIQSETQTPLALTSREREVLQLIAEGKTTKEIAFSFNLSVKTIEAHRQRIMEKLNAHSVAELTKYAIREGLTSL